MDPLSQVALGRAGTGAAVIFKPGVDPLDAFAKSLAGLKTVRAKERDAINKNLADFNKFDATGWFIHNDNLQTKRATLMTHVGGILAAGADPFTGQAGLKTNQLKHDLESSAKFSLQLRELYKSGLARLEGKQEDFTTDSMDAWTKYFTGTGFDEQRKSLPPQLIEKGEVIDFLSFIDDQAKGTAVDLTVIETDEVTITTKKAREAAVKLRIETAMTDPRGQAAINAWMQDGLSREAAEKRWEDRFRSNLDTEFKRLIDEDNETTFLFSGSGARSKNFSFDLQEFDVPITAPQFPGEQRAITGPGKRKEVSIARTDATENKPLFFPDPDDPQKERQIEVIPLGFRQKPDGTWVMFGKKEVEFEEPQDIEIPEKDVRSKIKTNFDGFELNAFLRDLRKGKEGDLGFEKKGEEPVEELIDLGF